MRKHFALFALLFLVAASLAGGLLGKKVSADAVQSDEKELLFKKYALVLTTIEKNAATAPEGGDLIYSSIRGMLQGLDPHSSFFNPKEFKNLEEDNSGRYYGLGIRIRALTRGTGRIVIIEPPFPGTPAAKVGLQAGDVIFKVNGDSIDDWDVDDVIDKLKGPKGTSVHITVLRPGEPEPLELDVVRDEIPKLTINFAYRVRPTIGFVKIEHFSETTHRELVNALTQLDVDSLEGLIIDLRDDPGGYLSQAIKICEEFLPKGAPIVSTKGRDGKDEQKYSVREGGNVKVPLVILINPQSASASEIVSAAVQDNDRGLIIGERSFGKGLVQSVYRLSDGSGLALTTGKYYAPSGRCLQRPFNGSIYDYYNTRLRKSMNYDDGEVKHTLSGRPVYAGGGVRPDIDFKAPDLKRFELTLVYKDVFFKFATQVMQGKRAGMLAIESSPNPEQPFEVTDNILQEFKSFLTEMKLGYTEEEFSQSLEFIRRGIKAEIVTRRFGILEGYKIRAEGDEQIRKALESIPQARNMLIKTKEILANIQQQRREKPKSGGGYE